MLFFLFSVKSLSEQTLKIKGLNFYVKWIAVLQPGTNVTFHPFSPHYCFVSELGLFSSWHYYAHVNDIKNYSWLQWVDNFPVTLRYSSQNEIIAVWKWQRVETYFHIFPHFCVVKVEGQRAILCHFKSTNHKRQTYTSKWPPHMVLFGA